MDTEWKGNDSDQESVVIFGSHQRRYAREIKFYRVSCALDRGEAAYGIYKTKRNHGGNYVADLGCYDAGGNIFYIEKNLCRLNPKNWESISHQIQT